MSEVILYTTGDGISKHIKSIYDDQELSEAATVNQKLTVQTECERKGRARLSAHPSRALRTRQK